MKATSEAHEDKQKLVDSLERVSGIATHINASIAKEVRTNYGLSFNILIGNDSMDG